MTRPTPTEFQLTCEARIAEAVEVPMADRELLEDAEGGVILRAKLGPAILWIYADEAQWELGDLRGYFEWHDFRSHDRLIAAFISDLNEIVDTGSAPSRLARGDPPGAPSRK